MAQTDEYFDCVNNWWSGFVGKETCEAGYLVCKGEECDRYTPEKKQKKQTNADRIRQMTDEELAMVLSCPYKRCLDIEKDCVDCLMEWLTKEAKECRTK